MKAMTILFFVGFIATWYGSNLWTAVGVTCICLSILEFLGDTYKLEKKDES